MSRRGSGSRVRTIELWRGAWGLVLLLSPRSVLPELHDVRVDRRSVVVTRILGARHLTQALLSGVDPSPEVLAMGVWVDAVHAATAIGLAGTDPSRAQGGLTDAAVAGGWAVLGHRDLKRGSATRRGHDRHRDRLARLVLTVAPGGAALLRLARRDRSRSRPST